MGRSLSVQVGWFGAPTPPATTITHGQQVNATNTGLNYNGVTVASLTAGAATYSTAGAVISGIDITGGVDLTGNNITLRNSRIRVPAGSSNVAINVTGSGCTIEGCLIVPSSGSGYMGIAVNANGLTVRGCDISGFENNMTISADTTLVELSYLHDSSAASNPGGHRDSVEIYGGAGHVLRKNRLTHPTGETSVVNCAPYFTGTVVNGVDLLDNMIDGGISCLIFDNQAAGIRNVRVLRNYFGGHETTQYNPYRGPDANDPVIVRTPAAQTSTPASVYWPNSGADINVWAECGDLTPNQNGATVT